MRKSSMMPAPQRSSRRAPCVRTTRDDTGDNLDYLGENQLTAATVRNQELLRLSMDRAHGKLTANKEGLTAVHFAVLHYRFQCLEILVEEYKVDVNVSSRSGLRPLHLVFNRNEESLALKFAKYLIKHGADVNAKTQENMTPLHHAAAEGLTECIQLLVEAGADPLVKDSRGLNPINLCKVGWNPASARYLVHAMWKKTKERYVQEVKQLERIKKNIREEENHVISQIKKQVELLCERNFHKWIDAKGLPGNLKEGFGCRADHVSKSSSRRHCKAAHTVKDADTGFDMHTVCNDKEIGITLEKEIRGGMSEDRNSRSGQKGTKARKRDVSPFVSLTKGEDGHLKIRTISGKVHALPPSLPQVMVKRSFFPEKFPRERICMPQDVQATHILDVSKKLKPTYRQVYESDIVFHLRQKLVSKVKTLNS